MHSLDRLNAVIEYVECHITDDIDLNLLAGIACCSTYNLQRMFVFIAEISIVEYIRKRRLTLAAIELQQSKAKVIDLAMKYGYESPVSFSRAFRAVHGITPSQARKCNTPLKAFPRLSFQITIKGVNEMNYRIVKTRPFQVFGMEEIVSLINEENHFSNEGEIWSENHKNGKYEKLFLDAGEEKLPIFDTMFVQEMCRIHGLMNYNKIDDTTYGYMQCSFIVGDSKTDGYRIFEIPETTWAVFPSELVDWDVATAVETLNKRFYSEWLPTSDYEKADAPEFEMYGGTPAKGYIELWIPITQKA